MNCIPAFLCLNSFVRVFQKRRKVLLWGKELSECYSRLSMSEQVCKNKIISTSIKIVCDKEIEI